MDLTHLFIGGGIIAALLPRLQILAAGLLGLLIERRSFQYSNGEPVAAWLAALPSLPMGEMRLETVPQRSSGRSHLVFCRDNCRPGLFLYRGRLFYVAIDRRNNTGGPELYWIRFTYGRHQLATAAIEYYNKMLGNVRGRFGIYRQSGMGSVHSRTGNNGPVQAPLSRDSEKSKEERVRTGLLSPINGEEIWFRTPPKLFFPPEIEMVLTEMKHSLSMEKWFQERGLPWRRSYLFHGPGGTGKTSMAIRIAHEHDLPVFIFDLASMSNREFFAAWQDVTMHAPCLAVFEDFDRVFRGSTNLSGDQGGGLTLDAVLNATSGAQPSDGVYLIITANEPGNIDPAISDGTTCRPGRVDRIIKFGPMNKDCRQKLADKMLDFLSETERARIVLDGDGQTAAMFQESCIRQALAYTRTHNAEPK